ncbi:MAG: cell division FtsA domain-containing protein [Candidatus Omnitrophota bacterium]
MEEKKIVFSLDIGTRKVVGIVAKKTEDKLVILDTEVIEHQLRTMLDGQIHNIKEVARVVIEVKQRLESRLNIKLKNVGVAVAGRALKTVKAKIEKKIALNDEISEDQVRNLELEAVSSVLEDARCDFGQGDYYCVGYSVIGYKLDQSMMNSLVGHFGNLISVEVIATFLPRVVFNSMLSVLHRAELEIVNLTLEPIAAINVIIPEDIRYLNILLLDIGAGTSDIALTRDGSVFAYGMVPEAGDEITEHICEKFILNFSTAETVKKNILSHPQVKFKDILGREYELQSAEIMEKIRKRVGLLADSIAECVYKHNQKTPNAIVLVGGGSLTPLLEDELSRTFDLPRTNIGIRLPQMIEKIEDQTGKINSPDMVTPLGISLMSADSQGLKFMELYVNDKRVYILDMHQNIDVLSALVAAGVDEMKLYGKIGRALCVNVNGKLKVIKGKMGKPAKIELNNQAVDLTTKIKNKDRITFLDACDGEDAQGKVKDVVDASSIIILVNGVEVKVEPQILMNGLPVELDTQLFDRADIKYNNFVQVKEVLAIAGIDTSNLEEREIVISVNNEPKVLSQSNFALFVNGQKSSLNTNLVNADVVDFKSDKPVFYRVKDVVDIPSSGACVSVYLNGQKHTIAGPPGKIIMNGKKVEPNEFLIDRAEINTYPGENILPTVSQILEYLPINFSEQKGRIIRIEVNGQPGGFTTQLAEGNEVKINFIKRQ